MKLLTVAFVFAAFFVALGNADENPDKYYTNLESTLIKMGNSIFKLRPLAGVLRGDTEGVRKYMHKNDLKHIGVLLRKMGNDMLQFFRATEEPEMKEEYPKLNEFAIIAKDKVIEQAINAAEGRDDIKLVNGMFKWFGENLKKLFP